MKSAEKRTADKQYIVLDLQYWDNGFEEHIHPTVLFGKEDIVLVDCGYPGSLEILESELTSHHIQPESITKLVLTHQDDDHIGAAAEIKEKYPKIQILASEKEEPYISGKLKNLRLRQAEEMQPYLPESQKEFGIRFCNRLKKVKSVSVDGILHHGDCFDWGGGCEIIATPGHTPGHISVCSSENRYFITGDAAVLENNNLEIANPQFCLDIAAAEKSLENIVRRKCDCYICYHGVVFRR